MTSTLSADAPAPQTRGVRRILSIDGGGIRGLIPALVLAEIERRVGARIATLFDLIAGTSTGGILAVGLTIPDGAGHPKFAAQDLVLLYTKHGSEIFRRERWRQTLSWVYGPSYSPRTLENILDEYAGDTLLSQAVTGLLVTAWELQTRTAWFFRSAQAKNHPETDRPMRFIARATSAAPTYFPPLRVADPSTKEDLAFVDGGLFANNPGLAAWVDQHQGFVPGQEVLMVSLGTGSADAPITYRRARRWGKVLCAQPIIGTVLDGASDTVEHELGQLLPADQYFRFQTDIPEANRGIDDASPANLAELGRIARDMIARRSDDLDRLCERLKPPAPAQPAPGSRTPTAR